MHLARMKGRLLYPARMRDRLLRLRLHEKPTLVPRAHEKATLSLSCMRRRLWHRKSSLRTAFRFAKAHLVEISIWGIILNWGDAQRRSEQNSNATEKQCQTRLFMRSNDKVAFSCNRRRQTGLNPDRGLAQTAPSPTNSRSNARHERPTNGKTKQSASCQKQRGRKRN